MSYRVLPCSLADARDIARNNVSAFWSDANWAAAHKPNTEEYTIIQLQRRSPVRLLQDRERMRHVKAVDEHGRLVGYIRWLLPEKIPRKAGEEEIQVEHVWPETQIDPVSEQTMKVLKKEADLADFHPQDNSTPLDDIVSAAGKVWKGKKDYMIVDYFAVTPAYQGKGIGTLLIQGGLDKAKELGLDVYVHAFKAGVRLYQKVGFEMLEQIVLDDSMYGGDGEWTTTFMEKRADK